MLVNSDHPCRPFLRGGWRNFACAADGGISHRSAADGGISHRSTAAGGISRSRRTAESATEPRRLAEFRVCGGRRNQPPIRGGWRKSFLRPRCPTCSVKIPRCEISWGDGGGSRNIVKLLRAAACGWETASDWKNLIVFQMDAEKMRNQPVCSVHLNSLWCIL